MSSSENQAGDGNNIRMQSQSAQLSSGQSYTLTYDNRLKIHIIDRYGEPQAGIGYTLTVGSEERSGQTDAQGWIIVPGVNASEVTVRLSDGRVLKILEDNEDLTTRETTVQQTATDISEEEDEYATPSVNADIFSEEELLEEFDDILEDEEDEDEDEDW